MYCRPSRADRLGAKPDSRVNDAGRIEPRQRLPLKATQGQQTPRRLPTQASAYFHYMLAHEYEEMATTFGRSEYATRAIEEYKMALNADPSSKYLNSHLAELYFRTGQIREAVVAAQDRIKQDPNDLEAHRLLADVYLRSLGDNTAAGSIRRRC